jgi:hypothetical protein
VQSTRCCETEAGHAAADDECAAFDLHDGGVDLWCVVVVVDVV